MGIGQDKLRPYKVPFIRGPQGSNTPRPSPSNHGSACFPLIIYLVARRCFLPQFVTFERRGKVTAERTQSEQPASPLRQFDTIAWEKNQGRGRAGAAAQLDCRLLGSCWATLSSRASDVFNRRMSQHVRVLRLTAGVCVAPRHRRASCLPSRVQCEETC